MLAFIAKRTLSMFPAIVVVCAGLRACHLVRRLVSPRASTRMGSVLTSRGFESLSGDEAVFGIK